MRRALVLVLAFGCGGGHGDGISLGEFPQEFANALCTHQVNCGEFPDVQTCLRANFLRIVKNPSDDAAVSAGKVIYDGGKARECVDDLRNATCDLTDGDLRTFFPAVCNEIAVGTVHGGAACALNIECISQQCDIPSCPDACCMGTCTGDIPPDIGGHPIGDPCTTMLFGSDCVADAFCDTTTHRCTALLPQGSPCNDGVDCDFGLGCAGTPNICKPLPQLGEACPDGVCRDEGQVCRNACVKVGLAGDPCVGDGDCSSAYHCDTTAHACAEGGKVGDPCTFSSNCWDETFCDVPSGMTAGTCVARKPDGQPCTGDDQCANGTCGNSNVCETPGVCI